MIKCRYNTISDLMILVGFSIGALKAIYYTESERINYEAIKNAIEHLEKGSDRILEKIKNE